MLHPLCWDEIKNTVLSMIRLATADDIPALQTLTEATGLFQPHELDALNGMISEHLEGELEDHCWVVDDDETLLAAAYYAPEAFAEGVWNLYFIGVHPTHQRKGRGSALLNYIEQALTDQGERLLLVETSGMSSFESTRQFYGKNGYNEEARIRDFYAPEDDKVIFRKALNTGEGQVP